MHKSCLRNAFVVALLPFAMLTSGFGCAGESASTSEAQAGAPGAGQDSGAPGSSPATTLTYHRDAGPVLNQYCVSCHEAGGLAPFELDSYAGASRVSALISAVVGNGRMPPLPADPGCRSLDDARVMPDPARQLLIDWVAQGAPEGDPNHAPPSLPPDDDALGEPDHVFDSGLDYVSEFEGTDEYRCFLIDVPVATPIDAVAFSVSSTNRAIVHHAFVELVRPADIDSVRELDATDNAPGWECFGGVGFDSVRVGSYVPGSQPKASPNGTGVSLPSGAYFVVNVHYNFLTSRDANRLSVQVWSAKQALTGTPRTVRLGNRTFMLAPGASAVTATDEANIVAAGKPKRPLDTVAGRAWGASGHMHLLGQSLRIDLVHADQSEECLLSIPAWDFNWQGDYRFQDPLTLVPGDTVRLTCRWDNSAENQPFIGGVQSAPTNVTWGEKSTDEMCLGGLTVTD